MIPDSLINGNEAKLSQPMLFSDQEIHRKTQPWRPIHYLGSKLRLVGPISDLLEELDPSQGRVCDLFAGSGTVSLALSQQRKVLATDIQEYSRVICEAVLLPAPTDPHFLECIEANAAKLFKDYCKVLLPIIEYERSAISVARTSPEDLCEIVESGPLCSTVNAQAEGVFPGLKKKAEKAIAKKGIAKAITTTRFYGGVYFSFEQALWIDAYCEAISSVDVNLRQVAMGIVLSTASEIVNTVGKQFAQPIKPRSKNGEIKLHLISKMTRDRTTSVSSCFRSWTNMYLSIVRNNGHRVVQGDYMSTLQNHCSDVSVVYADPPYTRDHYSRFYHVLETLCRRDSPQFTTTLLDGTGEVSRGLYRNDRHQSPFCIKSQAPSAFNSMFEAVARLQVPLLCSYSPYVKNGHPRLMTIDQIISLARNHFRKVELRSVEHIAHSRLNRTDTKMATSSTPEVFLLCQ
jgi:adenine-specific DNA-methyltransferase